MKPRHSTILPLLAAGSALALAACGALDSDAISGTDGGTDGAAAGAGSGQAVEDCDDICAAQARCDAYTSDCKDACPALLPRLVPEFQHALAACFVGSTFSSSADDLCLEAAAKHCPNEPGRIRDAVCGRAPCAHLASEVEACVAAASGLGASGAKPATSAMTSTRTP